MAQKIDLMYVFRKIQNNAEADAIFPQYIIEAAILEKYCLRPPPSE